MDLDSARGVDRRRLLGWGGLAAVGVAAGATPGHAEPARTDRDIPPDTRPGGAYDRFVAKLAEEDRFSGVVLLSHRGRTVLSRSYGMADEERGIRNHEDVAFDLSSASQPFLAVAVLRLAQDGGLALSDTVGTHLTGFPPDVAEQVTIHHLLTTTAGLDAPMPDWQRVFTSTDEVHEYHERWTRQATLAVPPGSGNQGHTSGAGAGLAIAAQIVEAVSGTTFWDYAHQHVFGRSGMRGSGYFTRSRWLTDEHIAHPYMSQADGSRVDAVRNLDRGGLAPEIQGRNPARGFIGHASGEGFATAPDLVRFAHALRDGTVLDRPYADLLTGAKLPGRTPTSFVAYSGPLHLVDGRQWVFGRGGANAGSAANWDIYPDTGWVGVVLGNHDDIPFLEILQQQTQAITGRPADPPGGGG
ncbi:serine hydrolase domain-containing protein [Actinophytocola oryzae]|uniref:CubicO group peptidase (Beta-lactamase class C family) n=1 Tax=Actinophytocola oryzae TaxID=502181 RepID=A0A4R7W3G2_9PSEU|nr:serine hydrolase domain-containing protein [Actinophytocola oryzae]TDV56469.1 CubicO group peptidase (beta-lactamase class C family) [Actinophytocola oryzae]